MKSKVFFVILGILVATFGMSYRYYQNFYREKMQMISNYAVDVWELAEGNVSGHAILKEDADDSPIQVPEFVYETLQPNQTGQFHFDQLTDTEKKVYAEILWALTTYVEDVKVSTLNNEMVSKCFQCVLNDHPEIFYVEGFRYTNYYTGDELSRIGITGTYTMSRETAKKYRNQIEACADQILENIPVGADEYEKTKYIYEYIIRQTEYDKSAENNQNIISVFLNKRSVCQGYTKAVQYLCRKEGIKATTILGHVKDGNHAWNLVLVDGNWYYLDATWGDSTYYKSISTDICGASTEEINYDYLLVTTDFLEMTHITDNVIKPPPCISIADNYYVREGLYFEDVNVKNIKAAFDKGYDAGMMTVTLKCASPVVYEQMKESLINDQKVFDYLRGTSEKISYIDNVSHNSISFWL